MAKSMEDLCADLTTASQAFSDSVSAEDTARTATAAAAQALQDLSDQLAAAKATLTTFEQSIAPVLEQAKARL